MMTLPTAMRWVDPRFPCIIHLVICSAVDLIKFQQCCCLVGCQSTRQYPIDFMLIHPIIQSHTSLPTFSDGFPYASPIYPGGSIHHLHILQGRKSNITSMHPHITGPPNRSGSIPMIFPNCLAYSFATALNLFLHCHVVASFASLSMFIKGSLVDAPFLVSSTILLGVDA